MAYYRWLLLLALVGATGCTAAGAAGAAAAPAAAAPTSATVGTTTVVAVQPAAAAASPPCTIWQFLGVPGAAKGVCSIVSCIQNRLGTLFPGLEAKPPLLAITNPANLQSTNPAVSAAAGAKADEDAAPQKIKAINYLGTIGCGGCYPEVQDALLAALDDCTEAVRFAAVNALRGTACGQCKVCRKKSCCSPKVMEKLYKVANDVDDTGCYKEPSPRVRRMARLAMSACGGGVPAPASTPLEGPSEGPPGGPATPPAPATPVVRAAAPPTRVASRSPVAEATQQVQRTAAQPAPQQSTQQPVQQTPQQPVQQPIQQPVQQPPQQSAQQPVQQPPPQSTRQAAVASSPKKSRPVPSGAGQPDPRSAPVATTPTLASRPRSTAKAPGVPTEAPPKPVKPAPAKREPDEQPARTRPMPPGPTTVKEAFPTLAQPAADEANPPLAVATGIEPVQQASNEQVQPSNSGSRPADGGTNAPALPVVVDSQAQAPASAERQTPATGPLAIFQTQAALRANVIRNPFVAESGQPAKKEIALVSGNQTLPGDPAAAAAATQWANWQVDAARSGPGQAPPAAAAPQVQLTDDQLLAYYRQNAGNYRGPTLVRWLWIRVNFNSFGPKTDAYAAAAALRQAAVEGQVDAALQKYPQTEIRNFDWTPANQLPSRSIAKALLLMQPGGVSVMMESSSGVEVVQLLESRPTTLSFEQARERILHDLMNASRR